MGELGSIDLNSKKPYYLQVRDLIQTKIESGELKPDEKLPSETELCRALKVSRTVIRQALTELEQLGLIRKRKGKGSFVSENLIVLASSLFLPDFLWNNEVEQKKTSVKILTKETIPANAQQASVLRINECDPILKIERLYVHNEEPVILAQSLLPARISVHLTDENLLWTTRYLNKLPFAIRFDHADHYLEIAYARKTEAKLLQVSIGMPLIKVTTYSFNKDNTPIAADTTFLRADRIRLRGTIFTQSGENHYSTL